MKTAAASNLLVLITNENRSSKHVVYSTQNELLWPQSGFPQFTMLHGDQKTTMGSSFAHWSVAVSQDVLEKRGEFPFPEYTVNRNI